MATNAGDRNSGTNPKKINLSDLKGKTSQRGRKRYANATLTEYLREMVSTREGFGVPELLTVTPKTTEKQIQTQKAKWRNRIVSLFEELNFPGHRISISWTDAHEMVVEMVETTEG